VQQVSKVLLVLEELLGLRERQGFPEVLEKKGILEILDFKA
jgi:hypothetical protein